MAVIIQNVTADLSTPDNEEHEYVIRINHQRPIATFKHKRSDGLAACLRRAANAVTKAEGKK